MTTQSPFMFFTALLLITQTLPLHAIRTQQQQPILSLSLHPLDSITDLSAQTLSRVEADAARVNYLNSRLRNALFKSNSSYETEEVKVPLTYLTGGYVAKLAVGQPATEMTLVADTGSEIVWLKCAPCSQCSDPVFDPSKSSTYHALSCTEPKCNLGTPGIWCSNSNMCVFQGVYGDGSRTNGDFVIETVSFGSSGNVENVAIGCAHQVSGNVQGFGGIIGLGPNPISLPNQLRATSFSYCMAIIPSDSGTLDFNTVAPSDSVIVTMGRNPVKDLYYYVELTGITVEKDHIVVPPEVYRIKSDGTGGVIVDSGTTNTYLDVRVYDPFIDAFKKNAHYLVRSSPVNGYEVCYTSPYGPTVSFQFSNGQSLELEPQNYFVMIGNTFCLAFKPTNQIVSIIGNVLQQRMRVNYDLMNNKLGFSPNKC